jgi:hypothetical protein
MVCFIGTDEGSTLSQRLPAAAGLGGSFWLVGGSTAQGRPAGTPGLCSGARVSLPQPRAQSVVPLAAVPQSLETTSACGHGALRSLFTGCQRLSRLEGLS